MRDIPELLHNIKERPVCRRVILKILKRDDISLETLLQDRYFRNLGYGMRCQLRLMLKEGMQGPINDRK